MMRKFSAGFTFVELTVTVAVSAILFGVAIPALSALLSSNHLAVHVNDLRGALNLSRSHAIRENRHVVLCKSADGESCDNRAQWSDGWIVYVDKNRNRKRDDAERLLRVHSGFHNKTAVEYRAFGSRNYIAFRPTGFTLTNGTFTFCVPRHREMRRALILSKTGRVRISKESASGDRLGCPA